MNVTPLIAPEVRAAVDRLFDLASSDTGQAGRVANFLLAWHNGADWGGFDLADLFGVDRAIAVSDVRPPPCVGDAQRGVCAA